MPRTRIKPSWQKEAEENQSFDEAFRTQVRVLKAVTRMNDEQVSKAVGVGLSTWYSHIRNPALVTKREERMLYRLCRSNNVPYKSECFTEG